MQMMLAIGGRYCTEAASLGHFPYSGLVTIRRTPDDFRVDEVNTPAFLASLAPERSASHPFAAYRLEKISLATPDALGFVARALRVPRDCVAAAGLKDRHAVTSQVITVDGAVFRGGAPTEVYAGPNDPAWRMKRLGFTHRAADATIIERNAFRIVLRGLSKREFDELSRRAATLAVSHTEAETLLVANYFGDQRFGSARHGQGFAARALIVGNFEEGLRLAIGTPARKDSGTVRALTRGLAMYWGNWPAALRAIPRMPERGAIETLARGGTFQDAFVALPKFTQEICVEAYQSYLWNAIVRELAHAVAETTAQRAYEAEDIFGAMIFPRAAALTPAFRALHIPVPSPRAEMPECLSEIVAGIMEDEGISLAALRIPGLERPWFGGGSRPFIAEVCDFEISAPYLDEFAGQSPANIAVTVSFTLPKGAYATVVLRSLGQ